MRALSEVLGNKRAVFCFGRFNPPTAGHAKICNYVRVYAAANYATPFIFLSQSQDATSNPLSLKQKTKYLELSVPGISDIIVEDSQIKTIYNALYYIKKLGFDDVVMVCGADRLADFEAAIRPFVNHPDPEKNLGFSSFQVVSGGDRDPNSDGVEGISASQMREYASVGDFSSFLGGVSPHMSSRFAREMFDDVCRGQSLVKMVEDVQKIPNSLNIPRSQMPQIQGKFIQDFIASLKDSHVSVHQRDVSVRSLKPTQNEINLDKVKKKYDEYSDGIGNIKPFIVSYDNYILDGHHQLFALKNLDSDKRVPCFVVDVPMRELLKYARKFPMTKYKTISEEGMKTLKKILKEEPQKQPTASDRARERQAREKEQMQQRQAKELEKAREQDFRKKEADRRAQEQQKTAEKLAKKNEDLDFKFEIDEGSIYEFLEDGTFKLVQNYKKSTPGQS